MPKAPQTASDGGEELAVQVTAADAVLKLRSKIAAAPESVEGAIMKVSKECGECSKNKRWAVAAKGEP